jgi:hypothetical protein
MNGWCWFNSDSSFSRNNATDVAMEEDVVYVPIPVVIEVFHNRIFMCSTKLSVIKAVSEIQEWFSLRGGGIAANKRAIAQDETLIETLLRKDVNVKLEFLFGRFVAISFLSS